MYALSFALASTLRCLSLTCHKAQSLTTEEKTLDILCCEEDDLELFRKLVAEGYLPTEKHIELAAENGSLRIYEFLRVTIPDMAEGTLILEKMFDKYSACLDIIPSETVAVELECSRKLCHGLKVDVSNAECWYTHHQFSFATNMYLVETGARLLYLCDLYSTTEMQGALARVVGSTNIGLLRCLHFPNGAPGIFRNDSTNELYSHMQEKNLLGYGYTGDDYERKENMYLVSFDIARGNERAVQLYGYKCLVEAYTDSIRDFDQEKLKLFRKHLTPLGIRVEYSLIPV